MLRKTILIGLAFGAAAVSAPRAAHAQGSPPVRWWSMTPESFFEARLLGFSQKKPELAPAARDAAKKHEAKITEYRARIQAEIAKLDTDRDALRKSGYQGTRAAWNDWFDRNRKLYEPIELIVKEFGKDLDGLNGTMPAAAPATPVPGPAPVSGGGGGGTEAASGGSEKSPANGTKPPVSVEIGVWATKEFVDLHLGQLPVLPDETVFRRKADEWQAGRTLEPKQEAELQNLVRKAGEKWAKYRDRRSRELERLPEVVRIIRTYPNSVKQADVTSVQEHWMDISESLNRMLADFEGDLQKIK